MIYVYLQGGLGNQLFQIFTTIAYSMKYNVAFKLPTVKNDLTSPYGEIYKRPLYFDNLRTQAWGRRRRPEAGAAGYHKHGGEVGGPGT